MMRYFVGNNFDIFGVTDEDGALDAAILSAPRYPKYVDDWNDSSFFWPVQVRVQKSHEMRDPIRELLFLLCIEKAELHVVEEARVYFFKASLFDTNRCCVGYIVFDGDETRGALEFGRHFEKYVAEKFANIEIL